MIAHIQHGTHFQVFIKEAKLLQKYNHPDIVEYVDFLEVEGLGDDKEFFLVMEYVDGVNLREAMRAAGHEPDNAEVTFEADTSSELDRDGAEKLLRLVDFLEDLDDVQEVYTNADISEEIMESLDS